MNQRDLPEVVAELIYEMHEVRSELKAINGRVDRLEQTMSQVVQEQRGMREDMGGMREDLQALPNQISAAMFKTLEPFLTKILDNNDQLKNHETRLGRLESPQ